MCPPRLSSSLVRVNGRPWWPSSTRRTRVRRESLCTRAEAPRYRRSGAQGAGEAGGRIARVGAAVALSGPAAMAGAAQRNAIKLAQDEINANRILDQVRLEVIVEDDGADRERAAA